MEAWDQKAGHSKQKGLQYDLVRGKGLKFSSEPQTGAEPGSQQDSRAK
jgi:hypothetical protein